MKTITKVFASIIGVATLVLQVPSVQAAIGAFVAAHPTFATFFGGIAAIFALLHVPVPENK